MVAKTLAKRKPKAAAPVRAAGAVGGALAKANTPPKKPPYRGPALRVLQVLPALNEGGVEQSAVEMALFLKHKRIFNMVASAGGWHLTTLERHRVPHVPLPLESKLPWRILANAVALQRVILENDINVVHARSRAPAWAAWLACKDLPHVRFVTTFHGTYGVKGLLKKWYNGVMLKGRLVIANSQFIAAHIAETYGVDKGRIRVAARGVDAAFKEMPAMKAMRALRAELEIPPHVPMLLFVGRLTSWKGQHVLLEALARLPKKLQWVAVFAGGPDKTGTYARDIQGFGTRLGLSKRLRWLGSRKDIPLLNATADVAFNLSTKPEAFGRTTIEAMAMGTPVVASAHGGSVETVQDGKTGWLVEAQKPQEVAKVLRGLLTDMRPLASVGAAARAHVLETYTSEQCCAAELQAYRDLWQD